MPCTLQPIVFDISKFSLAVRLSYRGHKQNKLNDHVYKYGLLQCRTFALIVSAHPYCANKFIERALSNKINNYRADDMAIAIALPDFNDLAGRTVIPICFLLDHFLYRISTLSEKRKKIYRLEVSISYKRYHRIHLLLALRLSVRQLQMPVQEVSFLKALATFGIINTTDFTFLSLKRSP